MSRPDTPLCFPLRASFAAERRHRTSCLNDLKTLRMSRRSPERPCKLHKGHGLDSRRIEEQEKTCAGALEYYHDREHLPRETRRDAEGWRA